MNVCLDGALVAAINDNRAVRGLSHTLYKYPGRFSPLFAREVIASMTRPGDVVLDPFVGGGDSAIEAAMGLAHHVGNQVTLSYRKEAFSRIKERNAQRIQQCMRKGKVKVIFNSNPEEFKQDSVILDVNGKLQEIPNDFVWIFAGGEPPTAFLKKIGVQFGMRDLTSEASKEAKQEALALN